MATYTPMMQQYLTIKADYEDAFLFFRLGDFYEMFFEDAIRASQELEITLTSRDGGSSERIPMCGVPYHSAPNYIEQLINKGFKVAICEQTEDPKQAKGVVRREVVQLITPGTVMDGKGVSEKENNFLVSLTVLGAGFGFAVTDLTTGETSVTKTNRFDEALNEIYSLGAKEAVIESAFPEEYVKMMKDRCSVAVSIEHEDDAGAIPRQLLRGLEDQDLQRSFARLYHYITRTQKRNLDHLQPVRHYELKNFLKMDLYSKRNLELTETIRSSGRKGSLLWLLDETKTAMGGRLLKQWMDRPLIDRRMIEERHEMVQVLLERFFEREDIREGLKEVYDLERLAGRVAFGNVNARDMIQLKKSLQQVPVLSELIKSLNHPYSDKLAGRIDPCDDLKELLDQALVEQPPISVKEGNMMKEGFSEQLDQYRDASKNGKTWIAELEASERQRTGIRTLKVGFNRVFGYYIEITRANLHLLPEGLYERKQTLTNAERFITPDLKEKEALILEAEENMAELEYRLFNELREKVRTFIPRLQSLAKCISELDVLQCFASVSDKRRYVRPVFSDDTLDLKDGRHPVVEKVLQAQEYVPNDCRMGDGTGRGMLLITGPNMSGKSTYMRQVALTAILAQIGCFVPAEKAILPIFDQIFTRIGAADDLISGQSTFMVEMLEARNAIVHATKNSLILFDEIGRGTSTYDGMALAQAMIEYIHDKIGAKTLFSTHYHELTILDQKLELLANVHVRAVERNGKVVFLHKISEGAADRSYGIHVAELAELPAELIKRAQEILEKLENQPKAQVIKEKDEPSPVHTEEAQLSFFSQSEAPKKQKRERPADKELKEAVLELNLLEMTPLDAMNKLFELQKTARE
ncbi:DNA mismatch repair protein MutS [Bacillus sp. FJAT-42376]|uniref:DNA mismatch repair protein MutS n=1 Tax=Bacillus sp. FJAT-42376 TaxID=2014076 RepID=UPI000F4E29DF|nr:DNA mismatch repair protein MutS [Bacillus sp. FJAT-42376]AZB43024.1 DNA mismatch repair protein MutS [Bacillus sp. FJAT-42376]